jgi:F0F1-type ATP synthase delta subunit
MEKYFEGLIKRIRTKEELIFFLEEIARVRAIIFKNGGAAELMRKTTEGKTEGGEELKKFLEKWEKEKVISANREKQSDFFRKLEKDLQSLPKIKLEIAFSPNEDFLDKISQWLEKELRQKTILDITVNPDIVGGAVVEYQGNWRDFSLAKEIDGIVSKNAGL